MDVFGLPFLKKSALLHTTKFTLIKCMIQWLSVYSELCSLHCYLIPNSPHLRKNSQTPSSHSLCPHPTHQPSSHWLACLYGPVYSRYIMQTNHVTFFDWFINTWCVFKVHSRCSMYSTSFPLMAIWYSTVWIYHMLIIYHQMMDLWLISIFWLLLICCYEHLYMFCVDMFNSFGSISRSRITGSYGNSIYLFEKLPNCFFKVAAPLYICTVNI